VPTATTPMEEEVAVLEGCVVRRWFDSFMLRVGVLMAWGFSDRVLPRALCTQALRPHARGQSDATSAVQWTLGL
jgi:hypothetical protein